jgi:O-antigen ligase
VRNLTRYFLWAFVFTVPWDNFALPLVGSVSRAFGLAAITAAFVTAVALGRFRKPDAILGFAIAFSVWNLLSLVWTIAYDNTVVLAITYVQLAISLWVIREFARTGEQVDHLLTALCFGLFVPLLALLNNFRLGTGIQIDDRRFSALGLNADAIGLLLVLGLPIAWHLVMRSRSIVRLVALIYMVTSPVALLLTGTRGAFVAGLAALAIVPITLPRKSLRFYVLAGAAVTAGVVAMAVFVPAASWERIGSTSTELSEGGHMSGRVDIWNAGLQAFPQRPLFGAGAGAYGTAVDPYLRNYRGTISAHNVVIGLLVEQGILGLTLFGAMFGACAWRAFHSPPSFRALWSVMIVTWLVGGLSGNPEGLKITWVLFGLISAQSAVTGTAKESAGVTPGSRSGAQLLQPVPSSR